MCLISFKMTIAGANTSRKLMKMERLLVSTSTLFLRAIIDYNLALDFVGPFCCDSATHGAYSLDFWLLNAGNTMLVNTLAPASDSDSNSDSDSDMDIDSGYIFVSSQHPVSQAPRKVYRPMAERRDLEVLVNSWRTRVHSEDVGASFFPMNDILPSRLIPKLVRLPSGSPELSTPASITKFVERSEDWMCIYAHSLYSVIAEFETAIAASKAKVKAKPTRRPRVEKPQDMYMGVLKTPKQVSKGKGRQIKASTSTPTPTSPSTSTPTTIASTSQITTIPASSAPAPSASTPAPLASTSQKRALPASPQKKTRKRAKREPLGEIPINYSLN